VARQRGHHVRFCHGPVAAPAAPQCGNRSAARTHESGTADASKRRVMNLSPNPDFPPPDFVAFLAQHCGLSEEAAENCLETWLDEYYAATNQRAARAQSVSAASTAA
jgi:hypothetical protein